MPDDFLSALLEPVIVEQPAGFERTEWAIIALARQDNLATLREPRQSRLGRLIFGRPRRYTLAGERLEALRRLAVEAWRKPHSISLPTLGAFISAGYSSAQLALVLSTTGAMPVMAKLISASLKMAGLNPASPNAESSPNIEPLRMCA